MEGRQTIAIKLGWRVATINCQLIVHNYSFLYLTNFPFFLEENLIKYLIKLRITNSKKKVSCR